MSSLNKHLMRMKTITRNFKWTWKKSGQGKLLFSPLPLFCFFSWWEKSKELVHITCGFWISLCWKTFFFLKLSEVLKIFVRLMSGVCFQFRVRTCFCILFVSSFLYNSMELAQKRLLFGARFLPWLLLKFLWKLRSYFATFFCTYIDLF